jgi:hypothetical protein
LGIFPARPAVGRDLDLLDPAPAVEGDRLERSGTADRHARAGVGPNEERADVHPVDRHGLLRERLRAPVRAGIGGNPVRFVIQ